MEEHSPSQLLFKHTHFAHPCLLGHASMRREWTVGIGENMSAVGFPGSLHSTIHNQLSVSIVPIVTLLSHTIHQWKTRIRPSSYHTRIDRTDGWRAACRVYYSPSRPIHDKQVTIDGMFRWIFCARTVLNWRRLETAQS